MDQLTESNSEEFHKGTEDLQKLADEVERDRAARAAQHSGDPARSDSDGEGHSDLDEALDAPEEERDVPMGTVFRPTQGGGPAQ